MTLRNLHGNAERCWAHLGEHYCTKDPGHFGPHAVLVEDHTIVWHDQGDSVVNVDGLDAWPDGAA